MTPTEAITEGTPMKTQTHMVRCVDMSLDRATATIDVQVKEGLVGRWLKFFRNDDGAWVQVTDELDGKGVPVRLPVVAISLKVNTDMLTGELTITHP